MIIAATRTTGLSVFGVAAALLLAVVHAAVAGPPESTVRADRLVDQIIDGRPVSCMFGNVRVERDTLTASADTAYFHRDRDEYEFVSNVRLTRQSAVLTCRRARYRRGLDAGEFEGDVKLVEGDVIATGARGDTRGNGRWLRIMGDALLVTPEYSVRADTIMQDRDSGRGEALGNVRIVEPGAANLVTGEHAIFDREAGSAVVDRRPQLISREQRGGNLVASSRLMNLYRSENRVVMVDSVRIRQALSQAEADTAVAYGRDRLVLSGTPVVKLAGGSVLSGERIEFQYTEGQLRRVLLTGAARMVDNGPDSLAAIYPGLPQADILEGDAIAIDFEDEQVRRSEVVGAAHSIYTPLDVTSELATNDVKGDTIIIHFRAQRVRRVRVMGHALGQYRFATLPTADSARVAAADSVKAPATDFQATAQTVDYGGDRITFELNEKTMDIRGTGHLNYGTMKLKAGRVKLATDTRELYAQDQPVAEDSDTIAGQRMGYNFQHRSAAVDSGVTSFDNYYYEGEGIRRFTDQTMKIRGGRMTSCDLAEPHFHFWSRYMKMKPGDKVVAAPIVLRIGNVPIFALPFYFKNLKEGRRSGILFPSFDFGWSSREGRYIRDLGYYWATNENLDFLIQGDFNENRDLAVRMSHRYVKRYDFNGGIDWSRRDGLGQDDSREWQLRWSHNQPALMDDYQFRADVKLASNTLSRNDLTGAGTRDIVSGQFKSNVYLSRNWSLISTSLNASRDGRVNAADTLATTDNLIYSMTLPALSVNFRQIALAPALAAGLRGSLPGDLLRATYFQQGYTIKEDRRGYEEHDVNTTSAAGTWSLRVQPPRLGIFNFGLSGSARQSWQRETMRGRIWVPDESGGGVWEDLDKTNEATSPGLSFGTSMGTTLYGLFPLEVGRLRAIRHTLRLNSGWNLSPALRGKQPHSTNVTLSVDQRFDIKYRAAADDTTATERKLDGVIDWTLSTSFNPQRTTGSRWSDIASGLTIKPGQSRYLQLKVSNTIDAERLALKDTRFSYGLSFDTRLDLGKIEPQTERRRNPAIERLGVDLAAAADSAAGDTTGSAYEEDAADRGLFDGSDADFGNHAATRRPAGSDSRDPTEGGRYLPFQTSASLSYSYTNATEDRRANVNYSVRGHLTRDWEISYQTSVDLVEGTALRQQYTLGRDLHCWRLEFNRTVSAVDSQFGFRLYLKSIPSLKFARGREDYMGALPGGLGGGF